MKSFGKSLGALTPRVRGASKVWEEWKLELGLVGPGHEQSSFTQHLLPLQECTVCRWPGGKRWVKGPDEGRQSC